MFVSLLLCFFVIVFVCIKKKYENKEINEFAKTIPGPKSWPIIGNMMVFAVPQKDILMAFNKVYKQYDSPNKFWIGSDLHVGIDKPEHIEAILTNPTATEKGDVYELIADCIGYGILQRNGPLHRVHRKHMVMPLRQRVLEKFIHVFNEKAVECTKSMEENVDGDYFDVMEDLHNCTMALISEMITGNQMNSTDFDNIELVKQFDLLYRSISDRIYKLWLHPRLLHRLSNNYREQKSGIHIVRGYFNNLINKRKETLRNVNNENFDCNENTSLDLLLLAKNDKNENIFNEVERMEQITTLFSASEDTTVTITSFALLMLAMHKDVQEKVWLEQVSVLGSDVDPSICLQAHHLKNMTYLHMVIQEVLRLFPIGPNLGRKLKVDLQMGDYLLPKNINIIINAYHAHRNENIWPQPNKFDPLRFTPEEKAKRHPYSYIPFSGGIRGCIGKEFAFIAIKCMLSNIVRNYTLHSDWTMDNLELEGDISVRSTNGYKIKIKRRQIR